jgi:hypothetical protein
MLRVEHRFSKSTLLAAACALLALAAANARAQSSDVNHPTPVFASEVTGRIAARDVGDPRRTRHFYAFRGTEGDVSVTLEASGLVGDVDVFTATTLRPLVKFTLLGDPTRITKSFYIRGEESLVLRVEARSAGDAEGAYRISFGGSFATAPASLADAPEQPEPTLAERPRDPNTRRVTSTGARIEEPKPAPTPAPTPAAEVAARPAPSTTRPAPRASARRNNRPARPAARSTTSAPQPKSSEAASAEMKPADSSTVEPGRDAEKSADTERPAPATPARSAPRRRSTNTRASRARAPVERTANEAQPSGNVAPAPAAATGRLVIITLDGQLLEREMKTVRSVTVENGQLVITTLDGKTIRRPMANVLRMSIEP